MRRRREGYSCRKCGAEGRYISGGEDLSLFQCVGEDVTERKGLTLWKRGGVINSLKTPGKRSRIQKEELTLAEKDASLTVTSGICVAVETAL